jgi:penicillin-binding protein 1C
MIVGLDPDIPADRQQVLFRAEPRKASLRFELDGMVLARADREYFWAPRPGAHVLRLLGAGDQEFDRLEFSVRGLPPPPAGKTAAP